MQAPPAPGVVLAFAFLGVGLAAGQGCDATHAYDHAMHGGELTVRRLAITCDPTIQAYPIAGPHNGGWDSNALDYTCHPHPAASPDNSDFNAAYHFGNDLFAAKGTPVVSPVDGTIYNHGTINVGGNRVTVEGPCGWLYYHAHLDTIQPGLWAGMPVSAGQAIGTVGNTGNAIGTSPHVHFSIYPPGSYNDGVDPFPYLNAADSTACDGGTVEPVDPPDPPPSDPLVELWVIAVPPQGQAADFRAEGSSEGVTDLYEGQQAAVEIWVHNDAEAAAAGGIVVGVAFEGQGVSPSAWSVYSDYPSHDQTTWSYNDANDHPANPSSGGPPLTGAWHLNSFSPGETKRLVFDVDAVAYSIGAQPRPEVRAWIWHVDDWYGEQTAWDDAVETNLAAEILQEAMGLDVYSRHEWHFEGPHAAETEGWTTAGGATDAAVVAGHLQVDAAGVDPQIIVSTASLDASVYTGIRLEVSLLGDGPSQLFFATEAQPDFDEGRSVWVQAPGDGQPQLLDIYLADNPAWQGQITGLRFDPPEAGAIDLALDFVEAAVVQAPTPDPDPDPAPDPEPDPEPSVPPCLPGFTTACTLPEERGDCAIGVTACLDDATWGPCLPSDDCTDAPVVGQPPTVGHTIQTTHLAETTGTSGCAGGSEGAPMTALVICLSLLALFWRRLRVPATVIVCAVFAACSGSDTAGTSDLGVQYSDTTNRGWETIAGVDTGTPPIPDIVVTADTEESIPDTADTSGPTPDPTGNTPCTTPNGVGCGCNDDSDCGVGLTCLGLVCTEPCSDDCLTDWVCAESLDACVPPHAMLCAPCVEDSDCLTPDATCVSLGVAGSYCGTPCELAADCPAGFACQLLGTGADAPSRCLPPGELCGCSGLATEMGASTGCHVDVAGTLCAGTRACGPDGLEACEPTGVEGPECGGADPDPDPDPDPTCDGMNCDDGDPCTDDGCDAGVCSHVANTASCDDGDPCTQDDTCFGGVCQPGATSAETCNALDDDCDGLTDENLSQACTTSCGDGTQTCSEGAWSACSAPAAVCDPADTCCSADGCHFDPPGTFCGNAPQSIHTYCDGTCGASVNLEESWPTCSGDSTACGAGGLTVVQAGTNGTCTETQLCVDGATGATCTECDFGCDDGACSGSPEDVHVICIDPGYGGPQSGPTGGGSTGAAVTWSLASHLVGWLEADTADTSGGGAWQVVLTRAEDEDPAWADRSAACNNAGADRLLAIYANAFNGAAHGSETHFNSADGTGGEALATLVQTELIDHGGLNNRGTLANDWFILTGTDAPGAMTFVGFLDNAGDAAMLTDQAWQSGVAEGFMHALQQAFGASPHTP